MGVWSSDDIFTMTQLPKSMIVIGGGYIGVELAQIMHALGSEVTLVARGTLLRGHVDKDLVPVLTDNMDKLGMKYRLNTPYEDINRVGNNEYAVKLATKDHEGLPEILTAEKVLIATGRNPDFKDLWLENAGVKVNNGSITVDNFQNTNVKGIYAIGDVTNKANLTPVAIKEGRMVSERVFNGQDHLEMNHDNIATVIFSHPPIGAVGLTEAEAIEKWDQHSVKTYTSNFVNMHYSLYKDQALKPKSMFKLVTHIEPATLKADRVEKVVGAFAIGKGVDEMMQGISIAINMGATK